MAKGEDGIARPGRAQTLGDSRLGEDFAGETFHADLSGQRSYHDFLELDKILDAQPTITGAHDEPLFFILHQVKELWMKLMLHELEAVYPHIRNDDLRPAFKIFARVKRIQENLIQAWHILTTMTPADYLAFRDGLGRSSGFQSFQYRSIEFIFGNKQRATIAPFEHRPGIAERLTELLERPSLYDEAVMLLARRGYPIDRAVLDRDWSQKREPDESVIAAWRDVYYHQQATLGALRAGGRPDRHRRFVSDLAVPPPQRRRAGDRPQDRHRRHQRRRLSDQGDHDPPVPGIMGGQDGALGGVPVPRVISTGAGPKGRRSGDILRTHEISPLRAFGAPVGMTGTVVLQRRCH